MNKIYMDHNATTPVEKEVCDEITPILSDLYGNPSSIHWAGRQVRDYIETARDRVAGLIGAKSQEIIFTSCGSESDNLAIKGVYFKKRGKGSHIITSSVEHPAVLETCRYLESVGAQVTYLKVGSDGLFDLSDLKKAIRKDTVLITLMHANNETGVIFPIKEAARLAREREIIFHTDAVQTVGKIPLDVEDLGVDLLAIAGHKIYGPKGVGALYVRKGVRLENIIHGGHQERGRRAGTENTAFIAGLGKACEIAKRDLPLYAGRVNDLRMKLEKGLLGKIDHTNLNGNPARRVPQTTNLSFMYIEGEAILLNLDMHGVAASSGSACSSGSLDPSHVLIAMGMTHERAHGSIRFSLGKYNTEEEVDKVLAIMPEITHRLRSMSPLWGMEQRTA